jgi:hypothetical protein
MAVTVTTLQNVGYDPPDGTLIGNSTTSKVAICGATPTAPAANVVAVATTGVSQSSPYGFTTSAQGDALVAAVNSILVCLKNKGLMLSA